MAKSPEIWVSGIDSVGRELRKLPQNDWMQMTESNSGWKEAAAHTDVFVLTTQYVLRAPDSDLDHVLTGLANMRIKLALAGLMLTGTDRCGHGIEGYTGPDDISRSVQRIKNHRAALEYLVMDEPLLYGHQVKRPTSCNDSVKDVAQQVAIKIRQARSIFPALEVGDTESVGTNPSWNWMETLEEWLAEYRIATGRPLDFFRADISWQGTTWKSELPAVSRMLEANRIPLNIIYNGDHPRATNQSWGEVAINRFQMIERDMNIKPAQATIASWALQPSEMLPETSAGTLTNVLRAYVRSHIN